MYVVCVCACLWCAMGAVLFGLKTNTIVAPSLYRPTVIHSFSFIRHHSNRTRPRSVILLLLFFFATNKFGGKCSVVVWVRAGEERLIFSCCLFKFLPFFSTYLLKSNSLERTSEQIDKDFRSVCFVMFAWCNMDSLVSGDRTWMGSVAVYQVMSEKKINKFTRKKNIHFKIINGVIVPIASSSSSSSS